MTISMTDTRKTYTGNGSTSAFPVPFRFDANTDLQVRLYDASGAGTLLTETTHYSLSGTGLKSGGGRHNKRILKYFELANAPPECKAQEQIVPIIPTKTKTEYRGCLVI